MTLYRNILRKAWSITWQNKYLWFFGLFAALIGNAGQYQILTNGLSGDFLSGNMLYNLRATGIFSGHVFSNFMEVAKANPTALVILLIVGLLVLALGVFLLWLAIVSEIAIVNNSALINTSKKNDFKAGMTAGINKFWPVFGLNFVLRVVFVVAVALVGSLVVYVISKLNSTLAGALYIILFAILMLLVLAFSFVINYAIGFVVLKKEKLVEAIKSGWQLFKENWLISMEMALILFVISFLVAIAYLFFALVMLTPFIILGYILTQIFAAGGVVMGYLAAIFYLAVLLAVGAMLFTFQISAWTTLFLQLLNKGGTSKIVRVVSGMVNK